jgi:hypothetical protein
MTFLCKTSDINTLAYWKENLREKNATYYQSIIIQSISIQSRALPLAIKSKKLKRGIDTCHQSISIQSWALLLKDILEPLIIWLHLRKKGPVPILPKSTEK